MRFPTRSDMYLIAEQVCETYGISVPTIRFFDKRGWAFTAEDHILLPTPEWTAVNHGIHEGGPTDVDEAVEVGSCYRLTLVHELAHWLEQERTGTTRHSPFMYASFFQMVELLGLDMEHARRVEKLYKPRASVQGWRLYEQWLEVAA